MPISCVCHPKLWLTVKSISFKQTNNSVCVTHWSNEISHCNFRSSSLIHISDGLTSKLGGRKSLHLPITPEELPFKKDEDRWHQWIVLQWNEARNETSICHFNLQQNVTVFIYSSRVHCHAPHVKRLSAGWGEVGEFGTKWHQEMQTEWEMLYPRVRFVKGQV